MKVGVIQSNYLPWRGYFDFIRSVDVFVFHDDLQYTKGDWRNRNRIKTAQGLRWLTVPVHYRRTAQLISETEIDYSRDWRTEHLRLIEAHLGKAPYIADVRAIVEPVFEAKPATISDLNISLIQGICGYLDIFTTLRHSADFHLTGAKTERLIHLLTALDATTYVSGPSAKSYLNETSFRDAGIELEYKSYVYDDYPQQWGSFEGAVSIVDLIANCGPAASELLKSEQPWEDESAYDQAA